MKKNISTFLLILTFTSCLSNQNKKQNQAMTNREFKVINHSYGNSNDVNISHLSLDLSVDFETKKLTGTATISYEEVVSTNELILDTKELNITKVTGKNDISIPFELGNEDPILGTPLWIDISSKPEKVKIHYSTSPSSEAIQWLSPEQTAQKEHPFLFTQSQAILARSWAPLMDTPSERFTYDAKVKCPKELMALMSASNPKEKSSDGTYTFEMPQPIPSYLLALAVGDLEYQSLGDQCGVYAEPSMMNISKSEFSDLQKMITSAEGLYGEYAWGMYDLLVLPASFPFGGMENPRLTFVTPTIITGDKSLVALVAHELAHSWSGNLVTNSSWNDFWLNEGFTVYFETRIMEAVFGKEYANMEAENGYRELLEEIEFIHAENPNDTKLKLDLDNRNPDDGMTSIAYEKGRFLLLLIEQTVGREKWDRFLNKYFKENAFKTMNTESFLGYMDKHLFHDNPGIKDSLNLDEWIYSPGLPSNYPIVTSELLDIVRSEIKSFENGNSVESLNTTNWTTHQWLYFLRNCNKKVIQNNMVTLDEKYEFTTGTNSEILCDWFKHGIEASYEGNHFKDNLKSFLIKVGRRKFLEPLYKKLAKHDLEFGRTVFDEAASGYHSVSRNTIDEILNGKK